MDGWMDGNIAKTERYTQCARKKTRQRVKAKVTQPCPTLCDPMDYTVCGILQARILEWGQIKEMEQRGQLEKYIKT